MRVYDFDSIKVGDSVITNEPNYNCPPARYIVGSLDYPNELVSPKRQLIGLERKDGQPFSNGNKYYWVRMSEDIMVFD